MKETFLCLGKSCFVTLYQPDAFFLWVYSVTITCTFQEILMQDDRNHSKLISEKVIEKNWSGEQYKKMPKALNIPQSSM